MAGERVRETNPFTIGQPLLGQHSLRTRSPYAARIEALWQQMREAVIAAFPEAPGLPDDSSQYLAQVESRYRFDAYHSLSIEGYQVNYDLIERIRQGGVNATPNPQIFAAEDTYSRFQSFSTFWFFTGLKT